LQERNSDGITAFDALLGKKNKNIEITLGHLFENSYINHDEAVIIITKNDSHLFIKSMIKTYNYPAEKAFRTAYDHESKECLFYILQYNKTLILRTIPVHIIKSERLKPTIKRVERKLLLTAACQASKLELVKFFCRGIDYRCNHFSDATKAACEVKSAEILKFFHDKNIGPASKRDLLKNGDENFLQKVSKFTSFDVKDLELAMHFNNLAAVRFLMNKLNIDGNLESLMKTACQMQLTEIVIYFATDHGVRVPIDDLCQSTNLDFVINVFEKTSMDGPSFLQAVVRHGKLPLVQALIEEHGVIPSENLAEIACEAGKTDCFIYLIDERVLRIPKHFFKIAKQKGHLVIASFLLKREVFNEEDIAIDFPFAEGYQQLVEAMLQRGADPNHPNNAGIYPLSIACENGLFDLASTLVDKGADPNVKNKEFPLSLACKKGKEELALKLVRKGAHYNIADKEGYLPLDLACQSGLGQLVQTLIGSKAQHRYDLMKLACEQGRFSTVKLLFQRRILPSQAHLFWACQGGSLGLVDWLLRGLRLPPTTRNPEGRTLMHEAYRGKSQALIDYLSKGFVSHIAQDNNGDTPLHLACQTGNTEVVRANLKHSQPVANKQGWTPLQVACRYGQLKVVEFSYQVAPQSLNAPSLLHFACCSGSVALVNFLHHNKKNIDFSEKSSEKTPFEYACEHDRRDLVKYFLKNLNGHSNIVMGVSAAVRGGHFALIDFLLKRFPQIHLGLPLQTACQLGNKAMVKYLMEEKRGTGRWLLSHAIQYQQWKVARYLQKTLPLHIAHEPSPTSGSTPLHLAACYLKDSLEGIKLLLKKEISLDERNLSGKTALHSLAESKSPIAWEGADLLLKAGADPNIVDLQGNIPLSLAAKTKNIPLIKRLITASQTLPNPESMSQVLGQDQELDTLYYEKLVEKKAETIHFVSFAKLVQAHFKKIEEIVIDYDAVPDVDFEKELMTLFETINFLNQQQAGFIDVKTITIEGKSMSGSPSAIIGDLRRKMKRFALNVKNRGMGEDKKCCMSHAPPLDEKGNETAERKAFFDMLQALVAYDIVKLKSFSVDPMKKNEHLVQFAIASIFCANRHKNVAEGAYTEIVQQRHLTFEDKIFKMFTDMRLGIVKELAKSNQHTENHLFLFLKAKRGLPGLHFQGEQARTHYTEESALAAFDARYHLHSLLKRLDRAFNNQGDDFTREEVLEWLRRIFPGDTLFDTQDRISVKILLKTLGHFKILDISYLEKQNFFAPDEKETLGRRLLEVLDQEKEALDLIQKGARLDLLDSSKRNALIIAAAEATPKVVKALLDKGIRDLDLKDNKGYSALHEAAERGDSEIVSLLLARGARPNIKTSTKKQPLHLTKSMAIADLLIQKGANPELTDLDGRVPSIKRKPNQADKYGLTPLHDAAISNLLDEMEKLFSEGANLHARDKQGYTPFLSACERGNLDAAKKLEAKDPSVLKATLPLGDTCLHVAAATNNLSLIRYLAEKVDINQVNQQGLTPLYRALEKYRVETAKELIRLGANIDRLSMRLAKEMRIYQELADLVPRVTGIKRPHEACN
jgi:ankyrin repeat protein